MRLHGHPRPWGPVRGPAGVCSITEIRLVCSTLSPATVTRGTEVHVLALVDMNAAGTDLRRTYVCRARHVMRRRIGGRHVQQKGANPFP
eukprot:1695977-Pyramimonas_sp.AAC.1